MIKAIIFDCFGVLYVDSSHYFYQRNLDNYAELKDDLANLNAIYDRGLSSLEQHVEAISELTGMDRGYVAANIHAKVLLNQELLDYSQSLRANYRVAMLSNIGAGGMNQFFSPKRRDELFDEVVLSSEVGLIKPEPEIYRLTAERLGVDTSECMMVDDSAANCAGAKAAGMEAIVYAHNRQVIEEIEKIKKST